VIEIDWRTSVAVDHDGPLGLPPGDGRPDGRGNEFGGHRVVQGVADNPVGEPVLDEARIELAGARGMLGDVRQLGLIWPGGGEVPLHQVVVDGRSWGLTRCRRLRGAGSRSPSRAGACPGGAGRSRSARPWRVRHAAGDDDRLIVLPHLGEHLVAESVLAGCLGLEHKVPGVCEQSGHVGSPAPSLGALRKLAKMMSSTQSMGHVVVLAIGRPVIMDEEAAEVLYDTHGAPLLRCRASRRGGTR